MPSRFRTKLTTLLVLALAGMAVFASQASARDRNHNGISDRWEKRYHLSLRLNTAAKDPDHDGLSNKCEFQAGTSPRDANSDGDSLVDGAEDSDGDGISNRGESRLHTDCGEDSNRVEVHGATVESFDGTTLVLDLSGGGTLSAPVSADLKCERGGTENPADPATPPPAVAAAGEGDGGPGHDEGDDNGDNEHSGPSGSTGATGGDDDAGENCTAADLVAGAVIHEAKIRNGEFVKIELAG